MTMQFLPRNRIASVIEQGIRSDWIWATKTAVAYFREFSSDGCGREDVDRFKAACGCVHAAEERAAVWGIQIPLALLTQAQAKAYTRIFHGAEQDDAMTFTAAMEELATAFQTT